MPDGLPFRPYNPYSLWYTTSHAEYAYWQGAMPQQSPPPRQPSPVTAPIYLTPEQIAAIDGLGVSPETAAILKKHVAEYGRPIDKFGKVETEKHV